MFQSFLHAFLIRQYVAIKAFPFVCLCLPFIYLLFFKCHYWSMRFIFKNIQHKINIFLFLVTHKKDALFMYEILQLTLLQKYLFRVFKRRCLNEIMIVQSFERTLRREPRLNLQIDSSRAERSQSVSSIEVDIPVPTVDSKGLVGGGGGGGNGDAL